jgi:oligo-alginate lyase
MMNIREKTQQYAWCADSVDRMAGELDELLAAGVEIPGEPGGWWHQYVCPVHHTELQFDPLEKDALEYRCLHGCSLEGEPYRGAWLVFKHQSLARYALQAAAVYSASGESRYAQLGRFILVRYARQYPHYPVHPEAQPWMLKGRAFHQALTEAIWATTLVRAYLLLTDEGVSFSPDEAEELESFWSMMETSMTQYRAILIHERKNPENNYTAWLNAALAAIYAARPKDAKASEMKQLIEDEGGILHHLTIGVHPDGFEFEGSTYYHVFVLRAYLIAAEMAERFGMNLYGIRGEQGQSFEGMLDVLTELASGQGMLPALHDGPYQRIPYAREIAEIFEIGYAKYRKSEYANPLLEVYRQLGRMMPGKENGKRGGLEAVVFGATEDMETGGAEARCSRLLEHTGFAVLRQKEQPLSVIADFGPHGGSHGHYDKLHISLEHRMGPVAPDMGMVPYGSSLRKEWYAETSSHNTVSIEGTSQAPHTGECVRYESDDSSSYLWIRSKDAYPSCLMNRHLLVTEDWVLDWFEVELEQEQQRIDWWFHHLGISEAAVNNWEQVRSKYGIHTTLTHRWNANKAACPLSLKFPDGDYRIAMTVLSSEPQTELFRIETPGPADDPSMTAEGLVVRIRGQRAQIVAVYRDGDMPIQLQWVSGEKDTRELMLASADHSWRCRLDKDLGLVLTSGKGISS